MELENIVANTVYLKARESGGGKSRGKSRKWKQLLALPPVSHCLHIKDKIPLTFKYVYEEQPIGKLLFRQYCQTSCPTGTDPTPEDHKSDINPYWNYILFLDAVSDFDLADQEDKERLRKELIHQYLTPSSGSYVFRTESGIDPQLSQFVDEQSISDLMREIDPSYEQPQIPALPTLAPHPSPPLASNNTNGSMHNMAAPVLLPGSDVRPKEPLEMAEPPNPFTMVSSLVVERLSATPFQDFVASKYFERYLQFKYLELQPITKNTFRMYRILGKGGFGEVCACQVRATGKMYACKKMEKKRIKKRKAETMALNEKNILTKVNSRFVVSLTYAFEAKDSLCLVLTLMNGGDLKFHIHSLAPPISKAAAKAMTLTSAVYRRPSGLGPGPQGGTIMEAENGPENAMAVPVKQRSSLAGNGVDDYRQAGPGGFEPDRARFYAAEIATGLAHLHGLRVAYRDLKPENILLDDEGHVRISDMGLGIEIPSGSLISGRVGTIGYMAPEVVKDKKYAYGPDWFSLGCLIYEMIDGKSPFRARKEKVNRQEINRRVLSETEAYNSRFSPEARDLCLRLMDKDPETRIGVMPGTECKDSDPLSVLNHPYFTTHLNMARLKAGKIPPPFIPDPRAVYCKDILDIDQFSTVKGVVLDNEDESYYKKFNTGSVSIPWQNEMIETDCFKDLNIFSRENQNSADLLPADLAAAEAEEKRNENFKSGSAKSFWTRIFGRKICCDDDDFF